VIQSILFFALGFLTAGFLALLIAPAASRRAAALMRKQVEASVPLTLDEIQADKDRMRAEFAMSARRLEISAKTLREKNAAQVIEIGRRLEEIKALGAEVAEKNRLIAAFEAGGEGLRAELHRRESEQQRLSERLAEADEALKQKSLEIEKLERMYDDASFSSSSRQIELVARESELEQLGNEAALLRTQAKEAEKRLQEAEGEAARLRDELARKTAAEDDLNARLVELQAEKSGLEAQFAVQNVPVPVAENGGEVPAREADRERLENRLTTLARENRKLKANLAALRRSQGQSGDDEALREQIGALAAQMVHLTSMLEGPGSPIAKALSTPAAESGQGGTKKKSLADRVRELQKAASAG
jgi:hypothetical protein